MTFEKCYIQAYLSEIWQITEKILVKYAGFELPDSKKKRKQNDEEKKKVLTIAHY